MFFMANWKMNKTIGESESYAERINELLEGEETKHTIVIFPPFTALRSLSEHLKGISVGAQDIYYEESGAFTGEISPIMVREAGASYVIIGHSERRRLFGETNESVQKKALSALKHGLTPVICIGESLREREAGRTINIIKEQLGYIPKDKKVIIAYEPLWAIGTGRSASSEEIEEVHRFIKGIIDAPVLYGGSVNSRNSGEILGIEGVDGALIGGASLDADEFFSIIKSAK